MSQKCSICKIDKQLSEFYIRKESGNYRKDCKECIGKRKIELRKKNTIINKDNIDMQNINLFNLMKSKFLNGISIYLRVKCEIMMIKKIKPIAFSFTATPPDIILKNTNNG